MRVLLLTPSYPPTIGGGEYYVEQVARELAQRGHEVTVITSTIAEQEDFWAGRALAPTAADDVSVPGVSVMRLPVGASLGKRAGLLVLRKGMTVLAGLDGAALPILRQLGRRFPHLLGTEEAFARLPRPDVIHSFNISWEQSMLAGDRLGRSMGIPHVISPFFHAGAADDKSVWRNSAMPHQVEALRAASAVLAVTTAERDALLRLALKPERVAVVGAAVTPLDGEPERTTGGQALPCSDDLPLLLFIGRVDRDKGALLAMRAMALLHAQEVSCQLALAGHVSPRARRLCRRLQAEGVPVYLLGKVSEATKHRLLERCVALLLPSRVESFGLVLVEAWQHGKPVVAARVGGPLSLVHDGQDGLLVSWGDAEALALAILTLLDGPTMARDLGRAGQRRVVEEFTWPRVVDRIEAAYRGAIAEAESTESGCS